MGGKALSEVISIKKEDIEPTLKYLSPLVGIPFSSQLDEKERVVRRGLEDCTLGTSAKCRAGMLGKSELVGDIDIVVDSSKYDYDRLLSRLVEKLGPENMGKPLRGLGIIPTKVPIAGDPSKGFVQVDFMLGDPNLLEFTFCAPDPESKSEFKGTYRRHLLNSVLQDMRRQVRDPDSQEVVALVGPSLLMDHGVVQQWRHFPMRKDGTGRLKSMKAISREEFNENYPEYVGKEKEFTISNPREIVEFMFPKSKVKIEDIDSYEGLRDTIIKEKPDRAESIFNRFIAALQREGLDVPSGLVIESVAEIEKARVLREVRQASMDIVSESIVKRKKFEEFRQKCLEMIAAAKKSDHFAFPNSNADLIPQDGLVYLMDKCGLNEDWGKINSYDYKNNHLHKTNDVERFYLDLCEMMGEDQFFFVTEHYGLKVTPESFIASLTQLDEYGK